MIQGERSELWEGLCLLRGHVIGAWVIGGDFKNVLNMNERIGSAISLEEISEFRQGIRDCCLHDVAMSGSFSTWLNEQEGEDKVFSKIARVCVREWEDMFNDAIVNFLPENVYDHCPCVIKLNDNVSVKPKSFRFFNMWVKADEVKGIMQNG